MFLGLGLDEHERFNPEVTCDTIYSYTQIQIQIQNTNTNTNTNANANANANTNTNKYIWVVYTNISHLH